MTHSVHKILFATNNPNKIREVREILGDAWEISSLMEAGIDADLPETSPTLEGNARQKAAYIYEQYGLDCFAEDTGLEVPALGGAPGVHTARYAGDKATNEENMAKLLEALQSREDRRARFRTIVAMYLNGEQYHFEGQVWGHIADAPTGQGGFGYDPVFIPDGYETTFAALPSSVKKEISHRSRAVGAMARFLLSEWQDHS